MSKGFTVKQLIIELLDTPNKEILVRCYSQGHRASFKIVAINVPGFGEPDHGKVVLTANIMKAD